LPSRNITLYLVYPSHFENPSERKMAHIVDCMVDARHSTVGLNNLIARELSPPSLPELVSLRLLRIPGGHANIMQQYPVPQPEVKEKEKYVWRLKQPSEPRRVSLFPAKEKLKILAERKNTTLTLKSNASTSSLPSQPEKATPHNKSREPSSRRRKPSVPELGTMTTVQELSMDSRKSFVFFYLQILIHHSHDPGSACTT
jgi:hypothetical protein